MCACVLSHFSPIKLFSTLWTVSHQAPLFMGFSRQDYWSGLTCPPPGDLSDPGVEPASLKSPALAGRFFTTSTPREHPPPPRPPAHTGYFILFSESFSHFQMFLPSVYLPEILSLLPEYLSRILWVSVQMSFNLRSFLR